MIKFVKLSVLEKHFFMMIETTAKGRIIENLFKLFLQIED